MLKPINDDDISRNIFCANEIICFYQLFVFGDNTGVYIVAPFSIFFPPLSAHFFPPPGIDGFYFLPRLRRMCVVFALYTRICLWLLRFFYCILFFLVADFIVQLFTLVFYCRIVLMKRKMVFLILFQSFSSVFSSFSSLFSIFALSFFLSALNFFPPALHFLPHQFYPAFFSPPRRWGGKMQQYTPLP